MRVLLLLRRLLLTVALWVDLAVLETAFGWRTVVAVVLLAAAV